MYNTQLLGVPLASSNLFLEYQITKCFKVEDFIEARFQLFLKKETLESLLLIMTGTI